MPLKPISAEEYKLELTNIFLLSVSAVVLYFFKEEKRETDAERHPDGIPAGSPGRN